jgi:hydroxymethylglutaryl-CoA reductase
MTRSSRIPGFYDLTREARLEVLRVAVGSKVAEPGIRALAECENFHLLDRFIENAVGGFTMPLGIAVNFLVDGRDLLVPMAIEESSVVAAASNMARLVRPSGGFTTEALEDLVIGQVQVVDVADLDAAVAALHDRADEIVDRANRADPGLSAFGGGCRGVDIRPFTAARTGGNPAVVVHLLVDCVDAMGANTVDTMCEAVAPDIATWAGGRIGLRILSNLADRRRFRARCAIPVADLSMHGFDGLEVAGRIAAASDFAGWDPYRAATHNKGIMNGVDAVVIATGNDWRAVEAGAHAWAARSGRYGPLSRWSLAGDTLSGELEMPIQVGTVGGVTRLHPVATFALRLLGVKDGRELARVMAAVGLAQNLGALRALATEGIQKGHMRLHARNGPPAPQGSGNGA